MQPSIWKTNLRGALYAFAAAACFSVVELLIKFVSADYALHQVVFYRAIVSLTAFSLLVLPFAGGLAALRTRRLGAHAFRGLCVVLANSFLFMGLASLPIADAVAIYFVAPLVTALFSVVFLGETVGPRRWAAIAVGLAGVMLIVRPGTSAFQLASIFPMIAALLYSTMHITARRIRDTESAVTMTAYSNFSFLIVSGFIGISIGSGQFAGMGHPDIQFLLRPWGPVDPGDLVLFGLMGIAGLGGVLLITQAYRLSEAAFAAPFEYVSIPLAILWGVTLFGTWPDDLAWVGIGLILSSGLYLVWRETQKGKADQASGVRNEDGVWHDD